MKKNLFVLLFLMAGFLVRAQLPAISPPEKGNYLCVLLKDSTECNFIFQESRQVYFAYNLKTKKAGSKSKGSAEMIKELFEEAGKIEFDKIQSVDPKKLFATSENGRFDFIQVKSGANLYKIVWEKGGRNYTDAQFDGLLGSMSNFW